MPSAIPQMEVCWQSGSGTNGNWGERWWSYTGNRRLWVFKQLASEGKLQKWKFEWWTENSNLSVFLLEMGVRVFVSVVLQHDWCLKEAAKRDSCFQ